MESSITETESKRIQIVKFLATIMVIYIHASSKMTSQINFFSPYNDLIKYIVANVICRSAVPAFFLISGFFYFYKEKSWKVNTKHKIKTLLIPYLFFNTLWILIFFIGYKIPFLTNFFTNPDHNVSQFGIIEIINAYFPIKPYEKPFLYTLWFLKDLFIINLLGSLLKKVLKFCPCSIILIVFLYCLGIDTPFIELQSVLFFSLGYYIDHKKALIFVDRLDTKIFFVFYICIIGLVTLLDLKGIKCNFAILALNVIGVIALFKISKSFIKNKTIINNADLTFFVYLFHEWNMLFFRKLCMKIIPMNAITDIFLFFMTPPIIFVLCLVVGRILKNRINPLYSLIIGGR